MWLSPLSNTLHWWVSQSCQGCWDAEVGHQGTTVGKSLYGRPGLQLGSRKTVRKMSWQGTGWSEDKVDHNGNSLTISYWGKENKLETPSVLVTISQHTCLNMVYPSKTHVESFLALWQCWGWGLLGGVWAMEVELEWLNHAFLPGHSAVTGVRPLSSHLHMSACTSTFCHELMQSTALTRSQEDPA